MRPFTYSVPFAFAALLLVSCWGSKTLGKKAAQLEAGGLYAEAADMYLQSATRNPKNVEAKIGLKKTGQQLLNDKLSTFFKAFSVGSDKEQAVNAYLEAKSYADRVGRAGVLLDIPESYGRDFSEVKGAYLVELYTNGQDLLAKQDYTTAEQVFAKIGRLEPGYKDASSLQNVAYLEPLYVAGRTAMQAKQYRKAYDSFGKVVIKDANYKDATALRQQCVEKGRYAIAVLPFTSPDDRKTQAAAVQAYATTALTEVNDPFLSVVDRENIQRILDEQRLGMTGVVDERSAVSAGKLLGAQVVLMGALINYREEPGNVRRSSKDGYEAYQVKQLNKETQLQEIVTKYKAVKYTEYYQENKVVLSFNYKLVNLETGQVLLSKVVDKQADDHAWYAGYDGNKAALVPALNGGVNNNANARKELTSLLGGSHEVKSTAVLGNDLLRTSCNGLASVVQQELSTLIP